MMVSLPKSSFTARIERLKVENFRALRNIEFKNLTPLTVLLGPNGSGKSTVFDVFAFLSECFTSGLRKAVDKRGRFKELRTRDSSGPIKFEIVYKEPNFPKITYHLSIDEHEDGPIVEDEWLMWRRGKNYGKPYKFLKFSKGKGDVISGEQPAEKDDRIPETLDSPDMLAVNTLGQLAKNPRVSALRRYITGWYLSYLTADHTRGVPEAGPQERLSQTGDNLPNVIQYLQERHPDILLKILNSLAERVPRLEKVNASTMEDGRLLLQLKDAPFTRPILSKWASDGTLKMLAYLLVLNDPEPPPLIGIEEPENHLHPKLLPELAEECRNSSAISQLMVTTHSPYFVNGLKPKEVYVLYRDKKGFTQVENTIDILGIPEMIDAGGKLGDLWYEGFINVGNPLINSGEPFPPIQQKFWD